MNANLIDLWATTQESFPLNLSTKLVTDWPPLAWLARFTSDGNEIVVEHGSGVETGEYWFAEAVWDGPFSDHDFDDTDLVFGSGGRRRGDQWVFVASGTMVDRLHSFRSGNDFYVSNSLACLTASLNATVDPHDRSYFAFFESVTRGVGECDRIFKTSVGEVHLTYFRNLVFDGSDLREVDKPIRRRELKVFDDYEAFLIESMTALGDNLSSADRSTRLKPIASISTGYDSPAVAAVARHAGLTEAISIVEARDGSDDDGSEIGDKLGLKTTRVPRDEWRKQGNSAIDVSRYLASDAKGEDVYFGGAAEMLAGRVLFTGYRGNGVWKPTDVDRTNLSRTDQSGLSHTEARLHGQYLHVPVPFFGALQENAIRAIGRSEELAPWRLGRDYDKPISRRIVEQAGVPREWFGQDKRAASVLLFDRQSFLPPAAKASFDRWCCDHQIGRRNPGERLATASNSFLRHQAGMLLESTHRALQRFPFAQRIPGLARLARSGRILEIARFEPEFDSLFPWALAETQRAYRQE